MRAVLQRVSRAAVHVDCRTVGEIGPGLLVLLCVMDGDTDADRDYIARKTAELRIFRDDAGKFNRSVTEAGGAVLVVSQFTLAAQTKKGRRPSFIGAAAPEIARAVCESFCEDLRARGIGVATGEFGAMMQVELTNDGPVTIWLDSRE